MICMDYKKLPVGTACKKTNCKYTPCGVLRMMQKKGRPPITPKH